MLPAEGRDPLLGGDGGSPMFKRIASIMGTMAFLAAIAGTAVLFRLSLVLDMIR